MFLVIISPAAIEIDSCVAENDKTNLLDVLHILTKYSTLLNSP